MSVANKKETADDQDPLDGLIDCISDLIVRRILLGETNEANLPTGKASEIQKM